MNKSCLHYINRCQIFAECCNKYYDCRRCHNDEIFDHQLNASDIKKIKCDICHEEQDIDHKCTKCKISFGVSSCIICRIFDDQTNKNIFHCDQCGICRVGGKDNFFHCELCNCCLNLSLKDNHKCFQNVLKQKCCICQYDMFDAIDSSNLMKCGHAFHSECIEEYIKSDYRCPLCHKTFIDMDKINHLIEHEMNQVVMPDDYTNQSMNIDCYECHTKSTVKFHIYGGKCSHCGSYNTIRI